MVNMDTSIETKRQWKFLNKCIKKITVLLQLFYKNLVVYAIISSVMSNVMPQSPTVQETQAGQRSTDYY